MPSIPYQHSGALRQSVQFPLQHQQQRMQSNGPPPLMPLNHAPQAPTPVRHLQHAAHNMPLPTSCAPLRSTLPAAGPGPPSRPQQRSWVPPPSADTQAQRQTMQQPLRRYIFLLVESFTKIQPLLFLRSLILTTSSICGRKHVKSMVMNFEMMF